MRLTFILYTLFIFSIHQTLQAQINAKLFRHHDISETHIAFVYGGDIWIVNKSGGTANQLTNSLGEESYPKFSPDGKNIAYTASYNGNKDVYVIPTLGGLPKRITYQSLDDRMVDWHPNGDYLLFASSRESGRQVYNQFYKVHRKGGLPTKLKLPYGELASYSPNGNQLAYVTKITEDFPFKRYRGGFASDILIYDTVNETISNITQNKATDGKPNWVGNQIFYMSDQGKNMRLNIWSYDTDSKTSKQITEFDDFDISYISSNSSELLFEKGGHLYLMNGQNYTYKKLEINIISDLAIEIPKTISVSGKISSFTASPNGKRVAFEARGEIYNVPVKEGYTINLTKSSGAFDRNPSWSPDGKHIAYWSDKNGEFELYLHDTQNKKEDQKLTNRKKGFGYQLHWSPNNTKIAFIDETNTINVIDVTTGKSKKITQMDWFVGHSARFRFSIDWSRDSNYLVYSKTLDNAQDGLFIYDLKNNREHQITDGFFNDTNPIFSADGNYIYFLTNRSFNPINSDLGDFTWIYSNSTQVASIALNDNTRSILPINNDEVDITHTSSNSLNTVKTSHSEKNNIEIDYQDIETRIEILPIKAGNINRLFSFDKKLVYWRTNNSGSESNYSKLVLYDMSSKQENDVISNIRDVVLTSDKTKFLIESNGKYGIIDPAANQSITSSIPTDDLKMNLVLKEEWNAMFNDTWRRHRDFFYDPNMHQLDWRAVRDKYKALLKDARTRWDVRFIQKNLVSELSAGHTWVSPGEIETVAPIRTGFLGINFSIDKNTYRIDKIIKPSPWNIELRSSLDKIGLNIHEGDYIHSVNGVSLDTNLDPYAPFEGLAGKTVELNISKTGKISDARSFTIKCLTPQEETSLRYNAWIEKNRKMVSKLSNDKLGYVYMSNTTPQGQEELIKMYYAQLDKDGFIIDARFNQGGQLADRFMELLQRPVVYNLFWRHGKDHSWPIKTNTGAMGMLTNGWSQSGGDALPWAFQELEAGPIVGERTLGILIGPSSYHRLIDGGQVAVPSARMYDNDGHWFWEGVGVTPDFPVWDDPNMLLKGRDPQIEKVVSEVLKKLETNASKIKPAPVFEDRTAKALRKN